MTRASDAVGVVMRTPPWYVRVFGVFAIASDGYVWLGESTPSSVLELVKHSIWLAIGLACFYPEGLLLVVNVARRLPFWDRRTRPRGRKP
jgi:hypothetical protein